ncbi:hypothetical protein BKA25_000909 [Actinoalloteichus hymeniacidonis]|uniref:Uncharacterized protein n=1 Tax=Actinoalloteichus hymeniacidonis TaxID=340345 RepID=A0AAC9HTC6_9PSEU|nr:hypothetical protein TL08_22710 [Actinoalloteichus hymeniacidonis]MBB5906593.1 hypothetical protein [Actinoalloteichus hymeniacidonis]
MGSTRLGATNIAAPGPPSSWEFNATPHRTGYSFWMNTGPLRTDLSGIFTRFMTQGVGFSPIYPQVGGQQRQPLPNADDCAEADRTSHHGMDQRRFPCDDKRTREIMRTCVRMRCPEPLFYTAFSHRRSRSGRFPAPCRPSRGRGCESGSPSPPAPGTPPRCDPEEARHRSTDNGGPIRSADSRLRLWNGLGPLRLLRRIRPTQHDAPGSGVHFGLHAPGHRCGSVRRLSQSKETE